MNQSGNAAIVLAAGEGKRMKSSKAKVLHEVRGVPMIDRVLRSLRAAGIDQTVVVTGHLEEQVRAHLGDECQCVTQAERKGTGHAVMQAEGTLADFDGRVIVACGDVPLLRPESLRSAIREFEEREASGLILTMILEDPAAYGRVIRNESGDVTRIVEFKDATEAERAVREVNSGTYCFDARALFDALRQVGNDNAQGEYYLTDVIEILIRDGKRVSASVVSDPAEAMGVNSPEELHQAESILQSRGWD